MTESEYGLYADYFTAADQPLLAGLQCGDESWSMALQNGSLHQKYWTRSKITTLKFWIYRNSEADDSVVGFSSLAATGWQRWPPPHGKRSRLLYIPQLGLDKKYRGFPPDPNWRYANQIMEHLIGQAREIALQIMRNKPPSKHVDLLTLKVHRQNVDAKKLYDRFGFELLDGFEDDEHLMMFHKLDLEGHDDTDE